MEETTRSRLVWLGLIYNRLAWCRMINPYSDSCESVKMYRIRKIIQNYLEVEKS
jgi:hypothetical protein